ncbi:hypothetical protein B0T16DRAFT_460432 [Cercophora newfieldiana]|uniref:Uncharacterized protein n=1 Tax=Cercophora newfieldiana TaxID=92897 RepID=A0AA39Y1N2_9PEZI|nr:hypothetical protein B0T16DRAFT_460432 [Cercophora newfieldiana]
MSPKRVVDVGWDLEPPTGRDLLSTSANPYPAIHVSKRRRLDLESHKGRTIYERIHLLPATPAPAPFGQYGLASDIEATTSRLASLRLKDIQSIQTLPDEIIAKIAENLAPGHVLIGTYGGTFLRRRRVASQGHRADDTWRLYFLGRRDLRNFRLVNKRFRAIATPLAFRSIFLSKTSSLWRLFLLLAKTPSLGSLIRHVNCAIQLEHHTERAALRCWKGLSLRPTGSTYRLLPLTHPQRLLWGFGEWCKQGGDPANFTCGVLASILSLAPRVESLSLSCGLSGASPGCPPLKRWLVPDEEDSVNGAGQDQRFINHASLFSLSNGPQGRLPATFHWPPPSLRHVTIEKPAYGSLGYDAIHLDVVPRTDAARHTTLLQRCNLEGKDPFGKNIGAWLWDGDDSRTFDYLNYIDGLKRISTIRRRDEAFLGHIDQQKALVAYPSRMKGSSNPALSKELVRTLDLLSPGAQGSLSVRNSHLVSAVHDFLVWGLDSVVAQNLESLDIVGTSNMDAAWHAATRHGMSSLSEMLTEGNKHS